MRNRRSQFERLQKSLLKLASRHISGDDEDEETKNLVLVSPSTLSQQDQALKVYVNSQKANLNKQQDCLLRKLIYFDTLVLDNENDSIKHRLYELFFQWRNKEAVTGVDSLKAADGDDEDQPHQTLTKEEHQKKDKEDRIEREKRA